MDSEFDSVSEPSTSSASSKLPWIIGGLAIAAGVGYYFYSKKTTATQATAAKPVAPGLPVTTSPPPAKTTTTPPASGPGTGAPGPAPVVAAPPIAASAPANPPGVVFNESTPLNKMALWKIFTMFPLTTTDGTFYALSQTPATTPSDSGASFIMQKDQASPGSVYVLMNPDNESLLFVDQGTAIAQAAGTSPSWTLYLKPGEWQSVAAAAAADSSLPAGGTPAAGQAPAGIDPAAVQNYLESMILKG